MKFSTRAVHQGVKKDSAFNSVITPLYPSSTFAFDKIGVNRGFDYTRSGNPTRSALEENLASLEGGSSCCCTCTGMAAETAVLHLLKPGDHVIAGHDIYGGSYRLMNEIFKSMGIDFSFVDMTRVDNIKRELGDNTRMVWIETPSNPLLRIIDIQAVSEIVKQTGGSQAILVADNTFMTPYLQKPLALGADLVLHSTTKYLNGHSDVVGGAVISNSPDLDQKVAYLVNGLGLSESPWDAWLVLRGVKTLSHRMDAHCIGALAISEFLEKHPRVKKVYYPGLPSHPQYALAKQQMTGFGGMLSFEMETDKAGLDVFFNKLTLFSLAESLGGVESLIESPWHMSHASMGEEACKKAGITPGTIRISVGIENPEDLIADLEMGLGSL